MRRGDWALLAVTVALVLIVGLFLVRGYRDCDRRGGTYVRDWTGWPVCINAERP